MIQFSKKFKFLIVILTFAFCILHLNVYAVEYKLMIPIPGHGDLSPTSLAEYLQWLFVFLVAVAGILALLMIMVGGFQYITAAGNESRVGNAKSRIQNAIIGLILALCSYVILNTINPNLAKLAHLPGLTGINPSDFKWDEYLKDFPKQGDKKHNLPDGAICLSHADCYYSRECKFDSWVCPLNQTPNADQSLCNASCKKEDGTSVPCEEKKVCEPLFDQKGHIEPNLIAIGFKCQEDKQCFDNVGSTSLGIPADPNIICNHAKGAICAKQNTYWQPCFDDGTECEGDLWCDTSLGDKKDYGLCNTIDGKPPLPKEPENGEKTPAFGDEKLFYSIESYSATTPKGTLFYFAIMAYEHKWSGIQKCEKLGSGWKNAGNNKEKLCQIRLAKQPLGLQTYNLKVTCDGKEKCTAYQWIDADLTTGTQAPECPSGWEKHDDNDDNNKCLQAGFGEDQSFNKLRDCCTYDIICCENKESDMSCNALNSNNETGWQDAKGENDAACMFGLKDIIFGADPWIARWYQVENPPLAKLSLPGKCCARVLKEGEKPKKEWKKIE